MNMDFQKPRWLRDLLRFIPLKSQFVLFGNVRDLQASEIAPTVVTPLPFNQALFNNLFQAGYAYVITYTPLIGFQCVANPKENPQATATLMQNLGLHMADDKAAGGIDMLNHLLE
ncbi:ATP-dependent Clp protease ATP-binding subunit, partial [Providencia rettgeri]